MEELSIMEDTAISHAEHRDGENVDDLFEPVLEHNDSWDSMLGDQVNPKRQMSGDSARFAHTEESRRVSCLG